MPVNYLVQCVVYYTHPINVSCMLLINAPTSVLIQNGNIKINKTKVNKIFMVSIEDTTTI